MAIDIKECTLNRLVFCSRDINAAELILDTIDGPVPPRPGIAEVAILKKGSIGFVTNELRYINPLNNTRLISVCFNNSISYWMDPEWISLQSPVFALTYDIAKLVNHVRLLEEQIKSFDETNRITELINEISTLTEHVEDVELEREVYIDAFAKMDIDPLTANGIARGNICPKCLESMSNHNGDGSCVEDDDNYSDDGTLWKDLYFNDLWARYEDAIKINEFGDGQDEWDWSDIEGLTASELLRRGIPNEEIKKFRDEVIDEEYGENDDEREEGDEWDIRLKGQSSLTNQILDSDMGIFDDDDDLSEDDIKLGPDIY
jgi:hypothetical protein